MTEPKPAPSRKERKRARAQFVPPAQRNPRAAKAIAAKKAVAVAEPVEDTADGLSWRFNWTDHEGPWPFASLGDEGLEALLLKLTSFESMTYHELFSGKEPGKHYPLDALCDRAQERLVELAHDDEDRISRLRITGAKRLYGFVRGMTFHVLWWDPEHEVCPSKKKHT